MGKIKKSQKHKHKKIIANKNKFWRYAFWSIAGLILLIVVIVFVLGVVFNTKFYPKTKVAGVAVNSMTQEEALKSLRQKIDDYKKESLIIAVDKKQKNLAISDLEPVYKPEETLEKLFKLGHPDSFGEIFLQIPEIVKLLLFDQNMPLLVEIKKPEKLEEVRQELSTLPKAAEFYLENNQLKIREEENGYGINEIDAKEQTINSLALLNKNVPFSAKILKPKIDKEILESSKGRVDKILSFAPVRLLDDKKAVYILERDEILKLIDLSVSPLRIVSLKINDKGKEELFPLIKGAADKKAKTLKLARAVDGSVSILQKDEEGKTLNEDDLYQKLVNFIEEPKPEDIKLSFAKTLAQVNSKNYKNFNFTKLLGKGESTFYGSSEDRYINIKVGSAAINGIVINNDSIFSLGESLGDVSEATGYKEGWVIKENSLASELGGGLCQITTTMFRAALNVGLSIEERHNHGYRVAYYEPPVGMDAAIYYPQLDLKFKNDTGAPILLQTVIENYKATYYLYGLGDGRKVEISEPQVFNITPAPTEVKYIEDPSLPRGTEILVDSAHAGSDAKFSYKVFKNDKIIIETEFFSHYEPWPAFIRRGTK
ncbi:MAG: VanW family protein [Patescibacteria group bacterium]|nr:VanW family protein [Patescibacteria group bacterium]